MSIFAVLVALEVAAVVLAVRAAGCSFRGWLWNPRLVAKKAADSVRSPLVLVLAYALADEVLVEALHRFLFFGEHPVRAAIERHGWPARAAYHLEVAVVVGWPAVLAGAAWTLFYRSGSYVETRPESLTASAKSAKNYSKVMHLRETVEPSRRARELLFGAWLVVVGGLASVYPLPRGWTAPLLHAVELLFVAVALAAIPVGWRSRALATRPGKAMAVLVVGELTNALIGAWALGQGVYAAWDTIARAGYLVTWAALVVILARR